MFFADADKASFVDTAIKTGQEFLRVAFVAIVTAESVIPFASFPNVFPVHGAITIISNKFFGPIGSAWVIEEMIFL